MEIASERYTKTCRWVLTLAHIQADEARATVITTEHMTAALAQETGCSAAKAMSRMGVDLNQSQGEMCIRLRRGIGLGIWQECFGP